MRQNNGQREVRLSYFFIRAARIRSKIQIMSEEKRKSTSGNFVICDVQQEYAGHLLKILAGRFESKYQFQLFHSIEKMTEFIEKSYVQVLLIGEEYGTEAIERLKAERLFILTGIPGRKDGSGIMSLFRYQSADGIIGDILKGIENGQERQGESHIREDPREDPHIRGRPHKGEDLHIRGLIGVYSPIHRIGKTKFAIRLGQKMARKVPVLYLNMEGYSGGNYYFQEGAEKDLGDLFYFLKQEKEDCGLKLTTMALQKGGMDYILPMKNEQDVRSVRKEEWISLLDMILEKCIYEVILLDLGDAINGLYDILRKCDRIYTPYICEGAAEAKLEQYENNLRAAGYTDILMRTVKRQMGRSSRQTGKIEGIQ